MKEHTTLFSVQLSEDDQRRFQAIAEYRNQKKAGLLRTWIRRAHNDLAKIPVAERVEK